MLSGEWDRMDDSRAFRTVWGTELALWAHDAGEQVAGWWRMYGAGIGWGRRGGYKDEARRPMEVKIVRGDGEVTHV